MVCILAFSGLSSFYFRRYLFVFSQGGSGRRRLREGEGNEKLYDTISMLFLR